MAGAASFYFIELPTRRFLNAGFDRCKGMSSSRPMVPSRLLTRERRGDPLMLGNLHIVLRGDELLHARHVAAGAGKGILEPRQHQRLAGRDWSGLGVAQNAAHGVTRQLERTADLAQGPTLRFEHAHAVADLGRDNARHGA